MASALEIQLAADVAAIFAGIAAEDIRHINGAVDETLRAVITAPPVQDLAAGHALTARRLVFTFEAAAAGNINKQSSFVWAGATYYVNEKLPPEYGTIDVAASKDSIG